MNDEIRTEEAVLAAEAATARGIVFGMTADGREVFYTGRAGEGWVSGDRGEAFVYGSQEAAGRKAELFNRVTDLHGITFSTLIAGRV